MKTFRPIAILFALLLVTILPLQAGLQYEELAHKLLAHLPQQGEPVRLAVVRFAIPEDTKGLNGAENVVDELEIALGQDNRVTLVTRTNLTALEKEWNFQEGALADPQTQAEQCKIAGIDVLVRGRVVLQEGGEVCIFAELVNVSNGTISKEKVSWMPPTAPAAAPAPAPQPAPQPTTTIIYQPVPQPVYQPAPQPVYQPAPQPSYQPTYAPISRRSMSSEDRRVMLQRAGKARASSQTSYADQLEAICNGGDINAAYGDSNGSNALNYAAYFGEPQMVRRLLELGAYHSSANNIGWTPAIFAVFKDRPSCLQALLDAGADANDITPSGSTLLTLAAANGYTQVISVLVSHGANLNAADRNGFTPLRMANIKGQAAAAALLRSLGASR